MVKKGYKNSEVGIIPSDWDVSSLKQCASTNLTYGINAAAVSYDEKLPQYIRITDIKDDGNYDKRHRCSVKSLLANKYLVKENDILLARTGASTGKSYIYKKLDGILVYAGFLIKININKAKADAYYVFSQLHTSRYWNWVCSTSQRSGQPGINGKEYGEFRFPCPIRAEQNAIAMALLDMDALIASLEKLLVKKQSIKQGAMQELLTGKKRLKGFSARWKIVPLSEIGFLDIEAINTQISPKKRFMEYSMPAYDCEKKPFQVDGGMMNSSRLVIKAPILLFNKLNVRQKRIWFVEKTEENAVCSTEFLPFVATKVNLYLLQEILLQNKCVSDFENMSTGTSNSQKRITPQVFLEYKVYLPCDMKEQFAIAEIINSMNDEISALQQKLEKYRQIKQGMMAELLTGRIRLREA